MLIVVIYIKIKGTCTLAFHARESACLCCITVQRITTNVIQQENKHCSSLFPISLTMNDVTTGSVMHFTSSNTNLTYIRSCLTSLKTKNRQSQLNSFYKTNTETLIFPALFTYFYNGPVQVKINNISLIKEKTTKITTSSTSIVVM